MAPTVISFENNTIGPPVYVAGDFSEWQAVETEAIAYKDEDGNDRYHYRKTFDLTPGSYHYKFRLGPGDWWICDDQSPKARDIHGNENNMLLVDDDAFQPQLVELEHSDDAHTSVEEKQLQHSPRSNHEATNRHRAQPRDQSEDTSSRSKMDVSHSDNTNQSISVEANQEKNAQLELSQNISSDQTQPVRNGKSSHDIDCIGSEGEPGPAMIGHNDTTRVEENILTTTTPVSYSNGKPIASYRSFRKDDDNLPQMQLPHSKDPVQTKPGSNDSIANIPDGGSRSDRLSVWSYGSSKRFLAVAIIIAVPVAMAYFIKKGMSKT